MKIPSFAALALCALTAACSDGSVQVDEEAYFKMHGRFYDQQNIAPIIAGSTDFIERRNDVAIEMYAGIDTPSVDVLSKDIMRWFKDVEQRNFPINVQVSAVASPLNKDTFFNVYFIDGSSSGGSPKDLKKRAKYLYDRARDGLDPRYHAKAARGDMWTKIWPVPE